MKPQLRKFVRTAHLMSSIGWFGAVAVFMALAIVGLTSQEAALVRAAYLAMKVTSWLVIVPLALASLLTGIVSSLGTRWGLIQYYWVVMKLLITLVATVALLVHLQPIDKLAGVAAQAAGWSADQRDLQILMVTASGAALIALLVLTALSVFKPQGLTPRGWRSKA